MKPSIKITEEIAESFAASFLEKVVDSPIFIGAYIEQVLAQETNLIFQYVEDDAYFDAAIKHMAGKEFINLNSCSHQKCIALTNTLFEWKLLTSYKVFLYE